MPRIVFHVKDTFSNQAQKASANSNLLQASTAGLFDCSGSRVAALYGLNAKEEQGSVGLVRMERKQAFFSQPSKFIPDIGSTDLRARAWRVMHSV